MDFIDKLNFKQHISVLVSLSLILLPVNIQALPSGSKVINGNVSISTTSNTMDITASNRAIINYDSFNINTNEIVKFIQPTANSVVLNRVVMANPSSILGQLNANGKVFLVNPAGIYFGKNSVINVNSFLATTLNISDNDFLNDKYDFSQLKDMAKSYIIQKGKISVSPDGFVVLASPFVSNEGNIIAKTGHITLGANESFYIQFDPQGLINYDYKSDKKENQPIVLPKEYADEIIDSVINSGDESIKIIQNGDKIELVGANSLALIGGNIEAKDIGIKSDDYINLLNTKLKANGGDITVFGDKNTFASKGATLIAEDGTVEISAINRVTYAGSKVISKFFYVDPDEYILIADDESTISEDYFAEATKKIVLKEGVTISTQNGKLELRAPTIVLERNSTLNTVSGDIVLDTYGEILTAADSITLEDGSKITTTNGNIDLKAPNITLKTNSQLSSENGNINLDATSVVDTKIDIQDGVEISGNDINITAYSHRMSQFDSDNELLNGLASVPDSIMGYAIPSPIAFKFADTSSTIDVGKANIHGTNINIKSEAFSDVSIFAIFQTASLTYGKSFAKSSLHIKPGATLNATSDITLSSEASSKNNVSGMATNLLDSSGTNETDKTNVALSYTDTRTESSAVVDSNVTISANNFSLLSNVNKDIATSASATSYSGGKVGSAVAVSHSYSNNEALLSGNITANTVEVNSNTFIEKTKTSSSAGVGNGLLFKLSLEKLYKNVSLIDLIRKKLFDKLPTSKEGQTSKVTDAVSAAVSFSLHENNSKAKIKDATIVSKKKVKVNSEITYAENQPYIQDVNSTTDGDVTIIGNKGIKTVAVATIDSSDMNEKDKSYSGAVVITNIDNNSEASIDDGVKIDTTDNGDINVTSHIYHKYNIEWGNIRYFDKFTDVINKGMDGLFKGRLFTSFAQSNAQGNDDAYSGSFNIFSLTNNSKAYIGKDVQINQNEGYGKVNVIADNYVQTLDFAGIIGWTYFGTKADGDGMGGADLNVYLTGNTQAYIDDGTKIKASEVNVLAGKFTNTMSISTAGGKANNALSGSFSSLISDDTTKAYIKGANIVLGDDSNKSDSDLTLKAEDRSEISNRTGGVVWGKNIGVGVSASYNNITRDTNASIVDSTINRASQDIGGYDSINALNSGFINTYALSGSIASDAPSTDGAKTTSMGGGKYGLGISGDGSVNMINDSAIAYVDNSKFLTGSQKINISAKNNSDIGAYSGAAVFNFGEQSNGLAGSMTINTFNNKAKAYVENSTIKSRILELNATNSGESLALAGSGVANAATKGISLAGSVAINDAANETQTYINHSDIDTSDYTGLSSLDDTSYKFFAGSLGVGQSFGLGLSFGRNNIGSTIDSHITDTNSTSNALYVDAYQKYLILGISISPAAGLDGMALAGSYSNNIINNTITSYIDNSSIETDNLYVTAKDNSKIEIYTGAMAGGTQSSAGASGSVNEVKNTIEAHINKVKKLSNKEFKNVVVEASSDKNVTLFAFGGSLSENISGAGALTVNSIKDSIDSHVNDSNFSVSDSMKISATEKNDILNNAETLSASTSSMAVGGGVSTNVVENNITAYMKNSNIGVKGNNNQEVLKAINSDQDKEYMYGLDILAYADESVYSNVVNLSGGSSGGASGSVSVNLLEDDVNSIVQNSNINTNNIYSANTLQTVRVRAATKSDIQAVAGTASVGGTGGVGASTDTSIIKNNTYAVIVDSNVKAREAVKTQSNGFENIRSIAVGGSGAGTAGIAGSVSVVVIDNKNNAYNRDSNIDSQGNLEVGASDNAVINGSFAGVIAGGGTAGVGASVAVTSISQDTQAHIDDSKTNASGTTLISAKNLADITTFAANLTLGGTAGVGGSVTVNTINSSAKAFTHSSQKGEMTINKDNSYKSSLQDVNITSDNVSSIYTMPGSGSLGGTAGIGVAVDVSTIHNTSLAKVGSTTQINAERNLLVEAKSSKSITSKGIAFGGGAIAGVSGSVLVANINANMDGNATLAAGDTNSTVNSITNQSAVGDSLGDSEFARNLKDEVDNETLVDVSDGFSTDAPVSSTYAIIVDNSSVNVNGSMTVHSFDSTYMDLRSGTLSLGIVGVGGSVSVANIGMSGGVYIGKDVNITSGSLFATSDLYFNNSVVKSVAAQGGIVGLGAAVSVLNVDYFNNVYIDDNSILHTKRGNIFIKAKSKLSSNKVEALGAQVGGVAAGSVTAIYNQKGTTQAIITKNAKIDSDFGKFTLAADHEAESLSSYSVASTGGVIGNSASVASIYLEPTVTASLGDNSTLNSGNNDSLIRTSTNTSASADAEGATIGVESGGVSSGTAYWTPILKTEIGSNVHINANNFTMQAHENVNEEDGTLKEGNVLISKAKSSGGSLIEGSNAFSYAETNSTVNLNIGNTSSVNTRGDINIDATSLIKTKTDSDGYAYGGFAGSLVKSRAHNYNDLNINIGDFVTLDSQKNLLINAYSKNSAISYAYGGAGGIVSKANLITTSKVNANNVNINIGNNSNLYANDGNLSIQAIGSIDVRAKNDVRNVSVATFTNTESNSIVNQNININIAQNSKIKALNLAIKAYVEKLVSRAKTSSLTTAANSSSVTTANNDISSETNLNIKSGVSMTGENSVELRSEHSNDINSSAIANAVIDAGITGSVEAYANNNANINSYMDVEKETTITTKNLLAKTYAPKKNDNIYNSDANADGNTVVNYVTQTVDQLVEKVTEVVSWIPFIGDVISEVITWEWETVEKLVKVVTNSKEISSTSGEFNSKAILTMNSDIYQRTSTPQKLEIDKNGQISSYGEISANINGNNIIVNDLINHDIGSVTLSSSGALKGSSNIYLNNKYSDITINNKSDKNIIINNIDVVSDNENVPNIALSYIDKKNNEEFLGNDFHYTFKTDNSSHSVNINNYGTGNIVLNGKIDNYLGDGNIYNQYGNIYETNGNTYFKTTNMNINAEHGAIGNQSNNIKVILEKVNDNTNPTFSSNSFYDSYLYLNEVDYRGNNVYLPNTNNIYLDNIIARGNINLTLDNMNIIYSNNLTNNTIYNIKNLQAGGNIRVGLKSFSDFNLNNGYISSGLKDQTVTIDPNLPDTKYIASIDNDSVNLKNISQSGGRIDIYIENLNTSRLLGDGNVKTLNGYSHINIENQSSKSVNIATITTAPNSYNGFYINGNKNFFTGYSINTFGYDNSAITINSNNEGKINLTKNLYAENGTVKITGNNGVYANNSAIINASAVELKTLENGSIGTEINPVYINSNILDAKSDRDINIYSTKDLSLFAIKANDNLNLYSNGFIKSYDDFLGSSIVADRVNLNAKGDITSRSGDALRVAVNTITANSTDGSIKINNSKDTLITTLIAKKDIEFNSDKTLSLSGDIVSNEGSVTLGSNDDMNINRITATESINLNSGKAMKIDNLKANDITLGAGNNILLSSIKSFGDVKITSKNGDILGNAKVRPTITLEKDLALYAHNGVIGTIRNPISVNMKDGEVIVEAGKTDGLLSSYILGINKPTGDFVSAGLSLFNNRIVGGALLKEYYKTAVNNSVDIQEATAPIGLPQDIVSPQFQKSKDSYIIGSL